MYDVPTTAKDLEDVAKNKKDQKSPLGEAALEYALAQGIPVFPLHGVNPDLTCTCGRACGQPGKHPRTPHGHKDATLDGQKIERWWNRWPDANIGTASDTLICLDVDVKRTDGHASLQALLREHGPLPTTATAATGQNDKGERGSHYWFIVPEGHTRGSAVGIRDGIDLKASNGYAILPPSMHMSGVEYEWIIPVSELAEAPQWLIELMPTRLEAKAHWEPPKGFRMAKEVREFLHGNYEPEDDQRTAFVGYARSILATGVTVEDAVEMLWEGYEGQGGIRSCENRTEFWPWTEEDARDIVETTYRTSPPPMRSEKDKEKHIPYDNTDADNGRRLIEAFQVSGKNDVFYVPQWGKWFIWDGTTWVEDRKGDTMKDRWLAVTRDMYEEAAQLGNSGKEDASKALLRWTLQSRQAGKVKAAVEMAQIYVSVMPEELNAHDYLLNVRNGVLDLRTGELSPADPELMLTKRCRAEYNPEAKSKVWNKALKEWIPDKAMREFVQRAFGYTLTGSIQEHKFFFFHGPPGSGKSTLVEALKYLMGNYAEVSDVETFMLSRPGAGSGPSEDLARLSNARMVVTSEPEEGRRFAEAKVAKLTGGDEITARFLHANSFTFHPKFKLFFTANHRPRVSGSAQSGLWRRLIVVPIDRVIPPDEVDPNLTYKLRSQEVLQAVLAWAVEGCRQWNELAQSGQTLEVPDVLKEEIEEYRTDADHLYRFVEECIVRTGNKRDRVENPAFYEVYQAWCEKENVPQRQVRTRKGLTQSLTRDHGLTKGEGRVGSSYNGPFWEKVRIPLLQGQTGGM